MMSCELSSTAHWSLKNWRLYRRHSIALPRRLPSEYAMKTALYILMFCVVAVASQVSKGDDNSAALPDLALQPPRVTAEFDPDTVKSTRGAQGVPAIERAANGRLWAAWYAGPSPRGVESSRSYVVLATSGDDGVTWSEQLLVRARRFVHTYDPCLWIDPQQRLWFFWAQSAGVQDGRMGVWAIVTENPGTGDSAMGVSSSNGSFRVVTLDGELKPGLYLVTVRPVSELQGSGRSNAETSVKPVSDSTLPEHYRHINTTDATIEITAEQSHYAIELTAQRRSRSVGFRSEAASTSYALP